MELKYPDTPWGHLQRLKAKQLGQVKPAPEPEPVEFEETEVVTKKKKRKKKTG